MAGYRGGLVSSYLEHISRDVIEEYPDLVRQFAYGKNGIYALYKKEGLYYVGLASDLRTRLKHHLKDRHANSWDSFSIYLTTDSKTLKDLESLFLRILKPGGNKQKGKFVRSLNLFRSFRNALKEVHREKESRLLGTSSKEIKSGAEELEPLSLNIDTIVCPAHEEGFKKVFIGEAKWHAIRINTSVIPHLKYVAIYLKAPISAITNFGRIKKIRPYQNTGKFEIVLQGRARSLRSIENTRKGKEGKMTFRAPRYTLFSKLKRAKTLRQVFE